MRRLLNDDIMRHMRAYVHLEAARKLLVKSSTKLLAGIVASLQEYGRKTTNFCTVRYGNSIICVSQ